MESARKRERETVRWVAAVWAARGGAELLVESESESERE